MRKQRYKKFLALLVLFSFLSTNVLAQDDFLVEGQDALNKLLSNQLELGKASKEARLVSKKIGSSIKRIQSALKSSETSCSRRLPSAISICSRAISLLEKKGCGRSTSSNCVSEDIVDEFLPGLQDALDTVEGDFIVDDDDNGVLDICDDDPDGDDIGKADDNCPLVSNPLQIDTDKNGIGDACDLFICCDSIPPDSELCDKKTIKQCREEERIIFNCMPPIKEGTSTSTPSDSITFFDSFRNFFGGIGVTSSFQTSGGLTGVGTTGGTSGGTTGTSSGGAAANNEDFINRLQDAVSMSKIPSMDYIPESYTCSDFADDLGTELGGLGFMTTFTAIWTDGGMSGHAITDIHPPGGGVVFVEPQTGDFVNLDSDGNGKVGVSKGRHSDTFMATEGDSRIEIYDSKDSAVMAGVSVPAKPGKL